MEQGRDRQLLEEFLGQYYETTTGTDLTVLKPGCALCVFDEATFVAHGEEFRDRAEETAPSPMALLVLETDSGRRGSPGVWEVVDDVVASPVRKRELKARVERLLRQRRRKSRLVDREARLERLVAELESKERAMDAAPVGIVIADATGSDERDNPILYVNDAFERLTGYGAAEVVGHDCRFLQGPETEPEPVAELRAAIDEQRPTSVELLNYRKDGQRFWNRLDVAPVRDSDGAVTHYVGFQRDVGKRRLREQRLKVLNRVLRHNLRNDMNQVLGYADLLAAAVEDPEVAGYVETITERATGLVDLVEKVNRVESVFETTGEEVTAPVKRLLENVTEGTRASHPGAAVSLEFDLQAGADPGIEPTVAVAVGELVENGIQHNDADDPTVSVRVRESDDLPGWVVLEVADNGPGIPEREQAVLERGETPLEHGDRVGLWMVEWLVERVGGEVSFCEEERGSRVVIQVPAEWSDRDGDPTDGTLD
jgi:PAS domain S-box-containing protein